MTLPIDVVQDVTAVLDTDETAITASQTTLQSAIDAIDAQIAALQAQRAVKVAELNANAEGLDIIAAFRALAAQFSIGSGFAAFIVPGAPSADPSTATPMTPGITTS